MAKKQKKQKKDKWDHVGGSDPTALARSLGRVFNKEPAQREERERICELLRVSGWWQAAVLIEKDAGEGK